MIDVVEKDAPRYLCEYYVQSAAVVADAATKDVVDHVHNIQVDDTAKFVPRHDHPRDGIGITNAIESLSLEP